jgi:hypothetical protein
MDGSKTAPPAVGGSAAEIVGPAKGPADWRSSETQLLLSMLELALTYLQIQAGNPNGTTRRLMYALDTYISVKNVLPKLDLQAEQVRLVNERLQVVQDRLNELGGRLDRESIGSAVKRRTHQY